MSLCLLVPSLTGAAPAGSLSGAPGAGEVRFGSISADFEATDANLNTLWSWLAGQQHGRLRYLGKDEQQVILVEDVRKPQAPLSAVVTASSTSVVSHAPAPGSRSQPGATLSGFVVRDAVAETRRCGSCPLFRSVLCNDVCSD
jgi:hypothetical protein